MITRENKKRNKQSSPPLRRKSADSNKRWIFLSLSAILLFTFLAYLPSLKNGFLHWDDDKYLQNNPLIYSFNLKEIFSTYVSSNYHPLTILVFSLEYYLFGFNAYAFHTVNLSLHLLNVILVFYSVFLLCDRTEVALIASLLFGIHPLHVESVAWIAELKDLLYTSFFLASYIFYLKYSKENRRAFYIFSLLLFLLSLLSKAMAVSLPLVLLLSDYLKGRVIDRKAWVEKIPFLLLSLIFGVIAIYSQKTTGAMLDLKTFTLPERIVFACYGFITYLVKLTLPLNLSAYYPYPVASGQSIPLIYYVYVFLLVGLVVFTIYSIRRSNKIFFGIGFFAVTILLVLQLVPVGGAVMADRYSYVSSIGFFYLAGEGFYWLLNKGNLRRVSIFLLVIITLFFSFQTYARCSVWKDDMTLWNDVISRHQTIPLAYSNRGNTLKDQKKYKEALDDFNKSIELLPNFPDAYLSRGDLLVSLNKYPEALNDFNKAIELNPNYSEAFNHRGNLFADQKRDTAALNDYNKAIALQPQNATAYNNRAILLEGMNRFDEALADYNKAISIRPNLMEAYFNRGIILMNQKKYNEALADYNKTIELSPNLAEAYYYRAMIEYNTDKKDLACSDLQQATNLGYQPAADAFRQFCR